MKKPLLYGFVFLLTAVSLVSACKKDKLQEPQALISPALQETAKVNGSTAQGKTDGFDPGPVTTRFQLPWVKVTDLPSKPWTSMDPPPQPYQTN